jgi:MFS family permease
VRSGLSRLPAERIAFALFLSALTLSLVRSTEQPDLTIGVGGTSVDIVPTDVALLVLAVVVLALLGRELAGRVRRRPLLLVTAAAFAAWLLLSAVPNGGSAFVSAAKVCELAVLGAAAVVVVRTAARVDALLDLLLAVTIAADIVGLVQYVRNGGGRVDAFLGTHDFSAVATLPLLVVLASIFVPHTWSRRRLILAGVAGWLGLALTAALASLLSLYVGTLLLVVLAVRSGRATPRRLLAVAAVLVVTSIPTFAARQNDLGFLHKWLGKEEKHHAEFASSWSQRLIYVYVGGRVWLAHPLVGTGWYGLLPPREFARYVPDARRAFPDNPANYFPPVAEPYIPQQAYDQVLMQLGLVGEALFVLALGSAAVLAYRKAAGDASTVAWVPLLFVGSLVGTLAGAALFGGLPIVAVMWLVIALPAASAFT